MWVAIQRKSVASVVGKILLCTAAFILAFYSVTLLISVYFDLNFALLTF
jgi:hypothetical protein